MAQGAHALTQPHILLLAMYFILSHDIPTMSLYPHYLDGNIDGKPQKGGCHIV